MLGTKEAVVLAVLKMAQTGQDDFAQIESLLIKLKNEGLKDFTSIRSPEHDTLLHLCARHGLEKTLTSFNRFCFEYNLGLDYAAVNIEGRTALHFAAMYINVPIAHFLINNMQAQGKGIKQVDAFGMMPIHMAVACLRDTSKMSARIAIETFLTDAGANLYDKIENIDITAFDLAGTPDVVTTTHRDIFGCTLVMRKISDAAALYNNTNKTTSDIAQLKKLEAEIKISITKYPHIVNAVDRIGHSALMYAVYLGCEPIVELLLAQKGIHVEASDKFGFTALHAAAFDFRGKNTNITKTLLAAGAKDVANSHGQKPSDIATQYGLTEIAQMINATVIEEELARVLSMTHITTPMPSSSASFQLDDLQPNITPAMDATLLSKKASVHLNQRDLTDPKRKSAFKLTNKH